MSTAFTEGTLYAIYYLWSAPSVMRGFRRRSWKSIELDTISIDSSEYIKFSDIGHQDSFGFVKSAVTGSESYD